MTNVNYRRDCSIAMALPIPLLPDDVREVLAVGLPLMLLAQKPTNGHSENYYIAIVLR